MSRSEYDASQQLAAESRRRAEENARILRVLKPPATYKPRRPTTAPGIKLRSFAAKLGFASMLALIFYFFVYLP